MVEWNDHRVLQGAERYLDEDWLCDTLPIAMDVKCHHPRSVLLHSSVLKGPDHPRGMIGRRDRRPMVVE